MSSSVELLERRLARERAARKQAEQLLEEKSREVFEANERLSQLNENLDRKVQERTSELRRKTEEAEAAARARGIFLAMMSHEIRTPMNGVLGAMDILSDTELDAEQKDLIATASVSGQDLLDVIDRILDYASLQSGSLAIAEEVVDPQKILSTIEDEFRDIAKGKGLRFSVDVPDSAPGRLIGDSRRIAQVCRILVDNAVKFTSSGGVSLRMHNVRAADDQNLLDIDVLDTGVGMTNDEISTAFSAFTQIDTGDRRRFDGTGLGLSVCKLLVDRLGGELDFASEPGTGSRVRISIPLRLETAAARSPLEHVDGPTPGPETSSVSVLLVEDNPTNLKIQSVMLKKLGVQLDTCQNGEEAVRFVTSGKGHIDMIFMDAQMPVMDGYEATRRIRAWEKTHATKPLPIVALTANTSEADREHCFEAGMNDFASKPTNRASLDALIEKWARQGTSVNTLSETV